MYLCSEFPENEMDQDKTRRPEKAGTAIKLLYISLGIGALQVNHGKTKLVHS